MRELRSRATHKDEIEKEREGEDEIKDKNERVKKTSDKRTQNMGM